MYMKRTVGTAVLFILLVLTVAALTQFEAKSTTALRTQTPSSSSTN